MSRARRTPTLRLTQRELDRYRKEVDLAADSAGTYVLDAMEAFLSVYPNADTAAMRNFVIEILQTSLPNFCDAAATLSADLFDEIAEALGVDVETRLYDTIDYDKVEQKVRYFAKFLNDGDTEKFKRNVTDVTRYYVKRSAFENMRENCRGQKVKYARVPSGFETCPFCFMLASRGFVYGSEKKALIDHKSGDKYHANCDCIVIPGFEDENGNPRVKIDGYDPQKMYENWLKCSEAVGVDTSDGVTRWSDGDVKSVMKEAETRDWHWLYTGEGPKYKADKNADPDEWELRVGEILRKECGFNVVFKARSLKDRRADTLIGGEKYEIKNPEGSMPLTVHNQIKKNLYGSGKKKILNPQSDKVIVSNVRSEISFDEMVRQAREVLAGTTGFDEEELGCISEIVILDKSGKMLRLKK